ncbi:MAG: hypothetical protein IKH46_05100 [Lachnospiraceae bacterium]|nr:hypothetical protein [Lachnospiraceae bacterium]MBR3736797.1 hypothetical protein [Lachnospiraceae bacterium]MBR6849803.1 hypothetical protein [Lachnospiraceae bacterium]
MRLKRVWVTPKADVQEVLPADRSEPEWEKVEGSHVETLNGYNRDLPQAWMKS